MVWDNDIIAEEPVPLLHGPLSDEYGLLALLHDRKTGLTCTACFSVIPVDPVSLITESARESFSAKPLFLKEPFIYEGTRRRLQCLDSVPIQQCPGSILVVQTLRSVSYFGTVVEQGLDSWGCQTDQLTVVWAEAGTQHVEEVLCRERGNSSTPHMRFAHFHRYSGHHSLVLTY